MLAIISFDRCATQPLMEIIGTEACQLKEGVRDIMRRVAHLRCNLLHWLRFSILLGHEEAPQVLIDNLGWQLNSIILICRTQQPKALRVLLCGLSYCIEAVHAASIEPVCADMRLLQSQHLTDCRNTPGWHLAQAHSGITKP